MKVLCPRCKQIVDLSYLEKKGDQMKRCANCDTIIAATFKRDKTRLYWEVYFEVPLTQKVRPRRGCGPVVWIAIVLSILIAMARCDLKIPYKLGGESEEQSQN